LWHQSQKPPLKLPFAASSTATLLPAGRRQRHQATYSSVGLLQAGSLMNAI
jgi:hypothetical protein